VRTGRARARAALGGVATVCVLAVVALASAASEPVAGDLDPGFGLGGKVTTGISQHGDDAAAAVVAGFDGKIVAAGSSGVRFAVTRYNADGTLDTSFGGGDGIVTTSFGAGLEARALGVAIEEGSGAIVAVGGTRPPFDLGGQSAGDVAVARYDENGNLDPGFGGGDGKVTTDLGENDDAVDVAIQGDGKIVVVAGGFTLARYETDGDLDPTFGEAGIQTTDFGTPSTGQSVGVQPDGGIVAAGMAGNSDIEDTDFAVARYESDGDPDNTFGTNGKVVTDFGGADDEGHDVVIQGGGELVVAGRSGGDFAVARYESDGDLDTPNFGGGDGLVIADLGGQDGASGVAIAAGGAIVAGGTSGTSVEGDAFVDGQLAVAKFESDGDPDATFGGGDGKVTTDFGAGTSDVARGLAVLAGGEVVLAGRATPPFASFELEPGVLQDFIVARYEADGDLDPTFGGDGTVETQIGDGFGDAADAVAVDADGRIVVAGRSIDEAGPDDPDFAVARYTANGDPDTSFSGDGRLTDDFEAQDLFDSARAVAVQGDGKIVVAGSSDGKIAVARYEPDGDPDPGFSDDGKLTTDVGPGVDAARDVVIQSNGRIVVSGGSDSGGLVLARYMSDGTPDASFSLDGKLADSFFEGFGAGEGVAIQSNGAIVVTGHAAVGFGLARFEPDGDPDTTFGGDGRVITDFDGGFNDRTGDLAIQPDGAIVVAGGVGRPDTPVADCGGEPVMDLALARYLPTGEPDTGFSGDGKLTTDFGGTVDEGFGLVVQPDGTIAAAGRANTDFALARYGSSGDLDATFSDDGKLTSGFGEGSCDVAHDVALSDGGLLLAGFTQDLENSRFALARYVRTVAPPATSTPTPTPSPTPTPPPPDAPAPPAVPGADVTAPTLSGLRVSPSSFEAAARGGSIARVGGRVSYRLSEAAKVRFTVERATRGRFVRLKGSFTHRGKQGSNRFTFRGRVGGRRLRPGIYRLVGRATDPAGNRSAVRRARLRIVRKR